jgi:hypothetical protein
MKNEIKQFNIPNTLIETMFRDVCSGSELDIFLREVAKGNTHIATSYASRIVYGWWKWYLFEKDKLEEKEVK